MSSYTSVTDSFDVIIIGAGPGGIFTAYELKEKNPQLRILIIEKGHSIERRKCPKRETGKCMHCKPCAITTGFSGAGAFSDGKLSLSPDVGGTLPEILGYDEATKLIRESDNIYLKFGAPTDVWGVDKQKEIRQIRAKAIDANLKLIECPIRHLGTEVGYQIYSKMQKHLQDAGVTLIFDDPVDEILIEGGKAVGVRSHKVRSSQRRRWLSRLAATEQNGWIPSARSSVSNRRPARWISACASRCATRSCSF